jgi:hypothetical protein
MKALHAKNPTGGLHDQFTNKILPAVERHANFYFRHVKCRQRRADLVAEAVDLAWAWFIRMAQRGKDATAFPFAVATFAARAVNSGRRLCGQEHSKDALSPLAQRRRGFSVSTLPEYETLSSNPLMDALVDNAVSPVPDQVAFRLDFPVWLAALGARNREIAQDMAAGERTQDLAKKYRVSQSRISQLRADFYHDWCRFAEESEIPAA